MNLIASEQELATEKLAIRPLSLRNNFSWTLAGNTVYTASQWGMLVAIAKLGAPEMVGQFALALAITAPVILFSNLSLRAVQATDARREYRFADYLGLRLLTTGLALCVIVGIVVLGNFRRETSTIILVMGMAKAFESLSDIYYGLFQQRERMDCIAKSMLIKGPLSLVMLTIGIWLTGSVFWGVLGLALVWLILLLLYDIHNVRFILGSEPQTSHRPRWRVGVLRRLVRLSLPLGMVMLLISLNSNIPRYIIERTEGEALLGIFSALAYLMVAGRTVVAALGQSATPLLSQYFAHHNNRAFVLLLLRLVGVGAMLGLGGILGAVLAGKWVLTLLYTSEYAMHDDVFILLMVAAGIMFMSSFLGYGLTAARQFKVQLPLNILQIVSTILGSLLLISAYGLRGAVWTLILSAAIKFGGNIFIVSRAMSGNMKSGRTPGIGRIINVDVR